MWTTKVDENQSLIKIEGVDDPKAASYEEFYALKVSLLHDVDILKVLSGQESGLCLSSAERNPRHQDSCNLGQGHTASR